MCRYVWLPDSKEQAFKVCSASHHYPMYDSDEGREKRVRAHAHQLPTQSAERVDIVSSGEISPPSLPYLGSNSSRSHSQPQSLVAHVCDRVSPPPPPRPPRAVFSLRGHTYMMSAQRGEGGVPSKADIVIKLSKGGCVNLRTRGVSKNPKILRTSYVYRPYYEYHLMTNIGNNDYFPDSRFKMPFYYIRNIA